MIRAMVCKILKVDKICLLVLTIFNEEVYWTLQSIVHIRPSKMVLLVLSF